MRKTFVNPQTNPTAQRVAALEKEIHELRQQLIRKEAEINRRESVEGKRLKLQNDLREVNEQIDATMRDIEGLQNQIHDYQRQLILDNDSHAVQRAASILISPTPEDTPDREKMLEQKIENVQRQRRSAIKIALKLLGNDIIRRMQSEREANPSTDILDLLTHVLSNPSTPSTPTATPISLQAKPTPESEPPYTHLVTPPQPAPRSKAGDMSHLISSLITSPGTPHAASPSPASGKNSAPSTPTTPNPSASGGKTSGKKKKSSAGISPM